VDVYSAATTPATLGAFRCLTFSHHMATLQNAAFVMRGCGIIVRYQDTLLYIYIYI